MAPRRGTAQNRRMDLSPLGVRATAGTLRAAEGVVLHHTWTDEGVVAAPAANGAHMLHLSVALCVLNDTYREAERLGVKVDGVAVEADGRFDDGWNSTGIVYSVTLDSRASAEDVARLHAVVDEVAEIPRAIPCRRAGHPPKVKQSLRRLRRRDLQARPIKISPIHGEH